MPDAPPTSSRRWNFGGPSLATRSSAIGPETECMAAMKLPRSGLRAADARRPRHGDARLSRSTPIATSRGGWRSRAAAWAGSFRRCLRPANRAAPAARCTARRASPTVPAPPRRPAAWRSRGDRQPSFAVSSSAESGPSARMVQRSSSAAAPITQAGRKPFISSRICCRFGRELDMVETFRWEELPFQRAGVFPAGKATDQQSDQQYHQRADHGHHQFIEGAAEHRQRLGPGDDGREGHPDDRQQPGDYAGGGGWVPRPT